MNLIRGTSDTQREETSPSSLKLQKSFSVRTLESDREIRGADITIPVASIPSVSTIEIR